MNNDEKQCPFCGEIIKVNANKCRYCGEWLAEKQTRTYSANIPENNNFLKPVLIGIFIVFVLLCLNEMSTDSIDDLTQGCTNNGDILHQKYYCNDKPWAKVEIKANLDAPKYNSYFVSNTKSDFCVGEKCKTLKTAKLVWYDGDYHALLKKYNEEPEFDGVCTEEEFVRKVKEFFN